MLLVTGATGTTGSEVLRALKDREVPARALVRDETQAHNLRAHGFEPVTGDLGDPRTLGPALDRVERGYLVSPTGPMQSELEQAFIESAKEAGVRHIVKLSVIGANPEAPLRFARSHGKVEHALKDSGMAWTLLRPTAFMQNTLAWGPQVHDGTFYAPVPDAPGSVVDARGVAKVPAAALPDTAHEGKSSGLSGPEAVSYRAQATRIFGAAGREVEVAEVPMEDFKRELVRVGVPPWNAEGLTELFELYANGGAAMVTTGVMDALGRDPRGLDAFAADHAEAFKAPGSGPSDQVGGDRG